MPPLSVQHRLRKWLIAQGGFRACSRRLEPASAGPMAGMLPARPCRNITTLRGRSAEDCAAREGSSKRHGREDCQAQRARGNVDHGQPVNDLFRRESLPGHIPHLRQWAKAGSLTLNTWPVFRGEGHFRSALPKSWRECLLALAAAIKELLDDNLDIEAVHLAVCVEI